MTKKPGRLRVTLGWMILIVALAALAINAFRPSRTRVVDLKLGTGAELKSGDAASFHYVGKLADGKVFDESRPRGVPIDLGIGRGMVIKGWDSGLIGMRVGGVRRLIVPPEEGYGAKGSPPVIPPGATLTYEVELIGIK